MSFHADLIQASRLAQRVYGDYPVISTSNLFNSMITICSEQSIARIYFVIVAVVFLVILVESIKICPRLAYRYTRVYRDRHPL